MLFSWSGAGTHLQPGCHFLCGHWTPALSLRAFDGGQNLLILRTQWLRGGHAGEGGWGVREQDGARLIKRRSEGEKIRLKEMGFLPGYQGAKGTQILQNSLFCWSKYSAFNQNSSHF